MAYASQFVDDAKVNHILVEGDTGGLELDLVEGRVSLFNMATCHAYFRLKTFNYEAMINNTCAFHFVPGCKGENFTKKLRCAEESPVILDILAEALQEGDLIKLGIVLHAYADTFSHQGFSGLVSKVNDINECQALSPHPWSVWDDVKGFFIGLDKAKFDKLFDAALPAYGHGQALEYPDIPHLWWTYVYDASGEFGGLYAKTVVDNRERYRRAFTQISTHLQKFLELHPEHREAQADFRNSDGKADWNSDGKSDLEPLFQALLHRATHAGRERNWQRLLVEQGFIQAEDEQLIYDPNRWLQAAFLDFEPGRYDNRRVEGARLSPYFAQSEWYQYYRAVKWYKRRFYHYCSKYQLAIPV